MPPPIDAVGCSIEQGSAAPLRLIGRSLGSRHTLYSFRERCVVSRVATSQDDAASAPPEPPRDARREPPQSTVRRSGARTAPPGRRRIARRGNAARAGPERTAAADGNAQLDERVEAAV